MPRYLANIESKGQHPSLQIFIELMLRYNISIDQFLLETPPEKSTQRRQLDALLDGMSDAGIRIATAAAKEIAEVETEGGGFQHGAKYMSELIILADPLPYPIYRKLWRNGLNMCPL